jgi:hypothetical protein
MPLMPRELIEAAAIVEAYEYLCQNGARMRPQYWIARAMAHRSSESRRNRGGKRGWISGESGTAGRDEAGEREELEGGRVTTADYWPNSCVRRGYRLRCQSEPQNY